MSVLKIPTTLINFKQKQDNLGRRAAAVYTGMNLNPTFPTPPITMADFVILVNAYNTALGTLRPAGKSKTQAKNLAKQNVITAMKALAGYVNEVVAGLYNTQPSHAQIANMRVAILSSGFAISKIARPVGNNTGLKPPKVIVLESVAIGTIHTLLRNDARDKKNVKVYRFEVRTSATTSPAAPGWPLDGERFY